MCNKLICSTSLISWIISRENANVSSVYHTESAEIHANLTQIHTHTHTHTLTKLAAFLVGISIFNIFMVKVPKKSVKVLTESKISCSFVDA